MLKGRLPSQQAKYPDPIFGVNLRDSLEDLQPGEAEKMGNCYYDGGTRNRFGSSLLTTTSMGAWMGRGGIRVYPQTAGKFRMVAFNSMIATVSDTGVIGTVTNTMQSDSDTHFTNWSITDSTYLANKFDPLCVVSSAQVFATVTGVNVPSSPTMVKPFLDRLFAVQGDGVWSSNPRVENVWSPNTSTWAVYRPSGGTGPPTAIHAHSLTGDFNSPQAQLLIFQESSVTALVGQDFGSDVTLATPPLTWDAQLILLSPYLGTRSPYSVVTVPGVGTFWFTTDGNVAWLSFSNSVPQLIGDKLFSNRNDITGVNGVNYSQLGQVRMVYHDRKLKLFLPTGSQAYSTVQYWLDLRTLQSIATLEDKAKLSWSGPMTGQSLSALWTETASGDNNAFYGCEGNTATGFYIYTLNADGIYTDAVGASTVNVSSEYRSFYNSFGEETLEKWIPLVRVDASGSIQNATLSLYDLHGNSVQGLSLLRMDGGVFTANYYGAGVTYDSGYYYGVNFGQSIAQANVNEQSTTAMLGDAIQLRIAHSGGKLIVNNIVPQCQIRMEQPVS